MYEHQGYNYVNIPAFADYAHIKSHYESVVPIRGRAEECRPLGRRRYDWYEVRENTVVIDLSPENPLGTFAKSYVCRLYQTDVVEFFPNNDVVLRVCRWKGPTTMGMLTYAMKAHGSIVSASGKWYFRNNMGEDFVLPTGKGEELLLRKAEDGAYRPLEVKQEYTYKAKRKELNRIRKQYKVFIDYTKSMLSMDDKVTRDYKENEDMCKELGLEGFGLVGNGWQKPASNRARLMLKVSNAQLANDLDTMYKLATYCAITFGRYSYQSEHYVCDANTFVRGFNEVLKFSHSQEVFEAVEVEKGKAFIDRNAKYVEQ